MISRIDSLLQSLLYGLIGLLAVSLPLYASVSPHIDSVVFNVRPENTFFLRYLRYENRFDSSAVSCDFGEFRLRSNGQEEKIPFTSFPDEFSLQKGSNGIGIDTILQPLGRTESFELKAGTITFYRDLDAYSTMPCNTAGDWDDPTSGGGCPRPPTWQDGWYYAGVNRVLERTEFIIQIVRESDNTVLGTLDSVGLLPNPSTCWVPRYGTNPDFISQVRTVPSGLIGTTVYLRVSPRRYGATPYGLLMNKYRSYFSRSTAFEKSPLGKKRLNAEEGDSLRIRYFREIRDYMDNYMLAFGTLPNFDDFLILRPPALRDSLNLRYGDLDTIMHGHKIYIRKDSLTFANEYWGHAFPRIRVMSGEDRPPVVMESISPNPGITRVKVKFRLMPYNTATVGKAELYDFGGRKVLDIWSGTFSSESFEVEFSTNGLANGMYLLSLKSDRGVQLAMKRITIHRK